MFITALLAQGSTTSQAASLAGVSGLDIFQILNLPSPSWGLVIGIFFFTLVLLLGLTFRRNQIVVLIFSTYIALLLLYSFPGIENLGVQWEIGETSSISPLFKSSIFFALTFALFFLFSRSIVRPALYRSQSTIVNLLLVALWLGLLLSVVLSFSITPESDIKIGRIAENIFLGSFAQFSWILLSLLGVALIKSPKKGMARKIKQEEEEEQEEEE